MCIDVELYVMCWASSLYEMMSLLFFNDTKESVVVFKTWWEKYYVETKSFCVELQSGAFQHTGQIYIISYV